MLALISGIALPGTALANDDPVSLIVRKIISEQVNMQGWDRDDHRMYRQGGWKRHDDYGHHRGHRSSHHDNDDDDDDGRRGRWQNDDDEDDGRKRGRTRHDDDD